MKRFGDPARLALLLATVAAAPMALCAPAMAQDADEEIIVTARRTAESLQDVPASVSAFSEGRLEEIGATDATGLQGAVPNLNIVQGRGSANATNITIRGIGQPDALQTFDPAVGFYVDDVYYSRIRGTQMEVFDVERVEVLRGPQGTLYGRNTIGGAFKLVTRRPSEDPHGLFQVTVGDYGQLEGRVAASGPIAEGLAGGVTVFGAGRDGYVTNPTTGEEYNNRESFGGRVQLAWDASPTFSVDFSADIADESSALQMGQATTSLTNLLGVVILPISDPAPEYEFEAAATPSLPNSTELTHWGTSLRASWEISPSLTLRSITAYRDLAYDDYIDIDATALEIGDVFVGVNQDQFSQEFQALYEQGAWNVVAGVYYLREDVRSHQEAYADDLVNGVVLFATPLTSFLRTIDDDLQTTSMAVFANATYAVNDRLNISGGIRYTEEEKEYERSTSTFYNAPAFNATFGFEIEESWDDVSPMLSADYQLTDNVMIYGRAARGFLSGGFNGRANNPGEQAPYDPEVSTSYEIGTRTDWLDGRLLANFTIFHTLFEDFQARVSGTVTDPGTGLPSPELTVINAGELELSGAELELNYSPIENLRLDTQIGYLDASYGEFDDARFPGGSRAFQTPAFSPEWTARFGGSYEWTLGGDSSLTLAGSARFRSETALAVDNTFVVGGVGTTTPVESLFQDDYWLYDASLTWRANDIVSVALQGRNLSDEVYKTDGQEFSSVGNIRTVYYGAPQTWSVVFTARY
ncbi:TonB-dependent receptor [Vitreimonas sp.]|uniref:TonB-dependent receptor n=1 Tax=Vitreimonas sp. TaxID=3069702 RepID=UPI002ED99438